MDCLTVLLLHDVPGVSLLLGSDKFYSLCGISDSHSDDCAGDCVLGCCSLQSGRN